MARRWALLALLVFCGPALAAPYHQEAGDAAHSGVFDVQAAPVDVQRIVRVTQPGETLGGPRVFPTPWGLVSLAVEAPSNCTLLRFNAVDAPPTRVPLGPCPGIPQAYVAPLDLLILCGDAPTPGGPLMEARDAQTGALRWDVVPGRDLGIALGGSAWDCVRGAVDVEGGYAVMPIIANAEAGTPAGRPLVDHRIVRVELDTGRVTWTTQIRPSALLEGAPRATVPVLPATEPFAPWGVTLSDSGIVVVGWQPSTDAEGLQRVGVAAWLDPAGNVIGGVALRSRPPDPEAAVYVSNWAAASGPLATFGLGGRIYIVNPLEPRPIASTPIRAVEASRDYYGITGPAWWSDIIVMPLSHSVTAFDASDLTPLWSWTDGPEWDAGRVFIAPPGDAYVLNARISALLPGEEGVAALVRLSLERGEVLQRVPIPIAVDRADGRWPARILPLPDERLVVVSPRGDLVILGSADAALLPRVRASDLYPPTGADVELDIGAPGALYHLVSWGEGPTDNITDGVVEHRYVTAGERTVRVTAVYEDGRTATRETKISVGGTRPPSNVVAAAFAPDRQDLTFGVLGVVLTAAGAMTALIVRRRRRSLLDEEFRALEALREAAARDPSQGDAALAAFRARLRVDLSRGRIDDSQFALLDTRLSQLLRGTRLRILAPYAPRMSPHFRALLDAALGDGHLTPSETETLIDALAHESDLGADEKVALRDIIAAWRRHETGAAT